MSASKGDRVDGEDEEAMGKSLRDEGRGPRGREEEKKSGGGDEEGGEGGREGGGRVLSQGPQRSSCA